MPGTSRRFVARCSNAYTGTWSVFDTAFGCDFLLRPFSGRWAESEARQFARELNNGEVKVVYNGNAVRFNTVN